MAGSAEQDFEGRRCTQVSNLPLNLLAKHSACELPGCLSFYRYHGNSDEVGCFVAARPFSRGNRYFEVSVFVDPTFSPKIKALNHAV